MDPATDGKDLEDLQREAAQKALDANNRRNAEQLARRNAIADRAEQFGEHLDDEPLTDEMLEGLGESDDVRTAKAIARAQRETDEDESDEPTAWIDPDRPANDEDEEDEDDDARAAGADDVRIRDGVKQYRLVVNGKVAWRTLAQIRATAQKVESADEYLQVAADTVKTARRAAEIERKDEDADRQRQERKAQRVALLQRAMMGDEQATEQLAELLDATPSVVTPDVLQVLDERLESRVTFREAVSWFEGEYAAELKHPAMKAYAGQLDAELASQNPDLSPKKRLAAVGNRIRKELRSTYGIAEGSRGPSNKALRKADIVRPNAASSRMQAPGEDEGEDESPSSVIQGMARARHQPRAVVHGPIRNR